MQFQAKRIAVVGSGIAGLAVAWLLSARFHVILFEAESRLGGHTHSVDVTLDGSSCPVDTGFLVFNDRTYPLLNALFKHIGVNYAESDMSFSVRVVADDVEWAGTSLDSVFSDRRNLVRPAFLAMLRDLIRFNRHATALVQSEAIPDVLLGEYLNAKRYCQTFRNWYFLPMVASIWSVPTQNVMNFPLAPLLRFCHHHGLLQLNDRPRWRTVIGGGRDYVKKLAAGLKDVRTGYPVLAVARQNETIKITTAVGEENFDQVVLACHPDQSLKMLTSPSQAEREILAAIRYQDNHAVLHTDTRFMPRRKLAWAAWNYYVGPDSIEGAAVSLTYWINRLQPLPFKQDVLVTLNPAHMPRNEHIIGRYRFAHPIFDRPAIQAQQQLDSIQGVARTWFCGAWTRNGFHEDGLSSAVAIANRFGLSVPWARMA